MDKGGMCEKRDGEDSEESDEERKSRVAEFGFVFGFSSITKKIPPNFFFFLKPDQDDEKT